MAVRRGSVDDGYSIALPYLSVQQGEVVAVTGASGCGKSTLLELIGLILKPSSLGSFNLGSNKVIDVAELIRTNQQSTLADIRAQRLGFVLQTGGLLPFLNVLQNIQLPRKMLGLPLTSELTEDAIGRLNLKGLLKKKPGQLSIGERQRVSFVRAIAHQPEVLLADEPTGALDPVQSLKLFELIVEIVANFKIAALLVTHDWSLVRNSGIRNIKAQLNNINEHGGTVFHEPA